jgi:hypothetical protein
MFKKSTNIFLLLLLKQLKFKKALHNLKNETNTNFEQYLNKRQRTENEQMQDPLPVIEVKIPPINPLNRRTRAFHNLKS